MNKKIEKEIQKAVAYGMGVVCGKHNLHITKKEVRSVAKSYASKIKREVNTIKTKTN